MVTAAERDKSRTSPMTAAAMTGPTPDSLVRLVPVACTAAASFLWVSRIRCQMHCRLPDSGGFADCAPCWPRT